MNKIICNFRSERGTGLIEYVLLIALISFIGIASISNLGDALNNKFTFIGDAFNAGNPNNSGTNGNPNGAPPPAAPTGPTRPGAGS